MNPPWMFTTPHSPTMVAFVPDNNQDCIYIGHSLSDCQPMLFLLTTQWWYSLGMIRVSPWYCQQRPSHVLLASKPKRHDYIIGAEQLTHAPVVLCSGPSWANTSPVWWMTVANAKSTILWRPNKSWLDSSQSRCIYRSSLLEQIQTFEFSHSFLTIFSQFLSSSSFTWSITTCNQNITTIDILTATRVWS